MVSHSWCCTDVLVNSALSTGSKSSISLAALFLIRACYFCEFFGDGFVFLSSVLFLAGWYLWFVYHFGLGCLAQ